MKKIFLLLFIVVTQTAGYSYIYNNPAFYNQHFYKKGFITGIPESIIPPPVVQYNVPAIQQVQPYYVNRKHIKKKYRKYYPKSGKQQSFTIIEP